MQGSTNVKVRTTSPPTDDPPREAETWGEAWNADLADLRINPKAPAVVGMALKEAFTCYEAGAFTAAAIMGCRALAGACAAHGVQEAGIAASLIALHNKGLIAAPAKWPDVLTAAFMEGTGGVETIISRQAAHDLLRFVCTITHALFS
jgi:hypothetical protein